MGRYATQDPISGYERGFHLPLSRIPVGGVTYRARIWRGRRIYTRLRVSSRYGTTTVALDIR